MTDLDPLLNDATIEFTPQMRAQILDAIADQQEQPVKYHLAQMNTARFRHPMDHPDMVGFVEMLDPVNHQADSADGFIWRLTDENSNDATSITFYDDPLLLVNMSVWEDVESLRDYVYRTAHFDMVKRREEWADAMEEVYSVMWWVPAGHEPTVAEGDAKLQKVRTDGPTEDAFTFAKRFPPPSS